MTTIDLSQVGHHPVVDEIASVITTRTQNLDRGFFDVEIAYFLAKMAATMRVTIETLDRGTIPVNIYAVALGESGTGKGYSVSILENEILSGFHERFKNETFATLARRNLDLIATRRAIRDGKDEAEALKEVDREFNSSGAYLFTFDSGTVPALKQYRHKLVMADAGSINFQVDEIGSNLASAEELLVALLELYDLGDIKAKLVKNTSENQRNEEMPGKTPTNALLFGTPTKLFDGGKTESDFVSFLQTGYARRCFFGLGSRVRATTQKTSAEIFDEQVNPANNALIQKWHQHFTELADPARYGWKVNVDRDISIMLLDYKRICEERADAMPAHADIEKAEMEHRYFKALKLAGAYAFIDESEEMEQDHLLQAIKLTEEAGVSFRKLMNQDKPHVRLAKYLAGAPPEQTHADLMAALPFVKASAAARNEMMALAIAWGYRNNVVIKKGVLEGGIEVFSGETLKEVDNNNLLLTYSNHYAENYLRPDEYDDAEGVQIPLDQLGVLLSAPGMHWTSHEFVDHWREESRAIPGFDLLVFDVDGTATLEMVHDVLKDYTFVTQTTKRHNPDGEHRFRLIMPMNYRLCFDGEEYTQFVQNVASWLPFPVDTQTMQRSRKWSTNQYAKIHVNHGKNVDILRFIPKTSRADEYQQEYRKVASLDNLERWFLERIKEGNRNHNLFKFASALADTGLPLAEVETRTIHFNRKLASPLEEDELQRTVFVTLAKKYANQP